MFSMDMSKKLLFCIVVVVILIVIWGATDARPSSRVPMYKLTPTRTSPDVYAAVEHDDEISDYMLHDLKKDVEFLNSREARGAIIGRPGMRRRNDTAAAGSAIELSEQCCNATGGGLSSAKVAPRKRTCRCSDQNAPHKQSQEI